MKNPNKIKKIVNDEWFYMCNKCKEWLPEYRFGVDNNNSIRNFHRTVCKSCAAENDFICKGYKNRSPIVILNNKLRCNMCFEYLDYDCFWNSSCRSNRRGKHGYCKNCCKEDNITRFANSDLDTRTLKVFQNRIRSAKQRLKKKNLEFSIDIEFLFCLLKQQDNKCAISGLPLEYTMNGGRNKFSVSLDRIDPSKGYTKDNVQLVCDIVNRMKLDYSESELDMMCEIIHNNYKNKKK